MGDFEKWQTLSGEPKKNPKKTKKSSDTPDNVRSIRPGQVDQSDQPEKKTDSDIDKDDE